MSAFASPIQLNNLGESHVLERELVTYYIGTFLLNTH